MFYHPRNTVISGGHFITVNHQHNGMDILEKNIAAGAFHNSSERYDPPKCHPQTRLAVLEAIMDWLKDGQKTSFLLWLYGPAGAGKSAIAQTIAEMLQRLDNLAASFFWSRSTVGRNDETRLIATLAYQLIISTPQMRMHVLSAIETDPAIFSRSVEAQMESLIIEPMMKAFPDGEDETVDSDQPRLIILDGLDECGQPQVQSYILKVVTAGIPRFPIHFNVLIASRPEHEIRNFFAAKPLLSLTNKLCLDDKYFPDNDIRLFLVESFQSLKETHVLGRSLPESWPTEKDIDDLVLKSSGQFIYAATVLKFIASPRRRPDEQLKIVFGVVPTGRQTPFSELDALYLHIFSMVEDFPRVSEILGCHFFLEMWMSVNDIEDILFYERGDINLALTDLHSVLNVPDIGDSDKGLGVFHASLRDFLTDPTRSRNFFLDEGQARAGLTQHYMEHISKFPLSGFERKPSFLEEQVSKSFVPNCLKSYPTAGLFRAFLKFDFQCWVLATWFKSSSGDRFWYHPLQVFEWVIMLTGWFKEQGQTFKEITSSEMSLCECHLDQRQVAIKRLLDVIFSIKDPSNQGPALAHPLLVEKENRVLMSKILHLDLDRTKPSPRSLMTTGSPQLFPSSFNMIEGISLPKGTSLQECISLPEIMSRLGGMSRACMSEIQLYLLDRTKTRDTKRENLVGGLNYACLAERILETMIVVFKTRVVPEDQGLEIGRLCIKTFPFYLAHSDCTPTLVARLSNDNYFTTKNFILFMPDFSVADLLAFYDAVDLYLMRLPVFQDITRYKITTSLSKAEHIPGYNRYTPLPIVPANHIDSKAPADIHAFLPVKKSAVVEGMATAISSSAAELELKEASQATVAAAEQIFGVLASLTAKIGTLGHNVASLLSELADAKEAYHAILKESHRMAVRVSRHAARFDGLIIKFCSDNEIPYTMRIEMIDVFITRFESISQDAQVMRSKFSSFLASSLRSLSLKFRPWIHDHVEDKRHQAKEIQREIEKITDFVGLNAINKGFSSLMAELTAELPIVGVITACIATFTPFVMATSSTLCRVPIDSVTGLAIARCQLMSEKYNGRIDIVETPLQHEEDYRITGLATELSNIIQLMQQVCSMAVKDAEEVRVWLLDRSGHSFNVPADPAYVRASRKGVIAYKRVGEYLKQYADGVAQIDYLEIK